MRRNIEDIAIIVISLGLLEGYTQIGAWIAHGSTLVALLLVVVLLLGLLSYGSAAQRR